VVQDRHRGPDRVCGLVGVEMTNQGVHRLASGLLEPAHGCFQDGLPGLAVSAAEVRAGQPAVQGGRAHLDLRGGGFHRGLGQEGGQGGVSLVFKL
jgi:hypothetical protein